MNTRLRLSRLVSVFSRGFVPILFLCGAGSLWSAPASAAAKPALNSDKVVVLVPIVGAAKENLLRAIQGKGDQGLGTLHHECPGGTPHVQSIACGATVSDSLNQASSCPLSDGSYVDFYGFSGTAGQQVTVDLTAAFDTYLFLLDPSAMVVDDDDDGGGGTNSRIVFTLTSSGTWFIAANSFAANTFGDYNLALVCSGGGGGGGGGDPAAIVPVVGSTPGAVGQAFFRTSVQLHNPGSSPVSGRLVYHPQGAAASASDPSTSYALQPGETRSIPDLLPSMGLSGLGSLDVAPEGGTAVPLLAVRVFNDGGSFGTTGFTEEVVLPAEALGAGQRGVLVAPIDTALYRFNVGVRSLASGATLSIVVRNAAGTVTRSLNRTYAPGYFEQRDSASFLEGAAVSANDTITVQVTSGAAIVYGATVDNRTNDPSLQVARRVP